MLYPLNNIATYITSRVPPPTSSSGAGAGATAHITNATFKIYQILFNYQHITTCLYDSIDQAHTSITYIFACAIVIMLRQHPKKPQAINYNNIDQHFAVALAIATKFNCDNTYHSTTIYTGGLLMKPKQLAALEAEKLADIDYKCMVRKKDAQAQIQAFSRSSASHQLNNTIQSHQKRVKTYIGQLAETYHTMFEQFGNLYRWMEPKASIFKHIQDEIKPTLLQTLNTLNTTQRLLTRLFKAITMPTAPTLNKQITHNHKNIQQLQHHIDRLERRQFLLKRYQIVQRYYTYINEAIDYLNQAIQSLKTAELGAILSSILRNTIDQLRPFQKKLITTSDIKKIKVLLDNTQRLLKINNALKADIAKLAPIRRNLCAQINAYYQSKRTVSDQEQITLLENMVKLIKILNQNAALKKPFAFATEYYQATKPARITLINTMQREMIQHSLESSSLDTDTVIAVWHQAAEKAKTAVLADHRTNGWSYGFFESNQAKAIDRMKQDIGEPDPARLGKK